MEQPDCIVTEIGSAEVSAELSDRTQRGRVSLPNRPVEFPDGGGSNPATALAPNVPTRDAGSDWLTGTSQRKHTDVRMEAL
ncbi:MAG TPA: hypothetical protein VK714_19355 [Myxococcota bacterium]|nr:hypothetical protein [Myxococcota bacterium]